MLTMTNKTFHHVAIAADIHLRSHIWLGRPEIANDAFWSFSQIIDYCLANTIPLILAGDVLDSKKPSVDTMAFLKSEIGRMQAKGLPVYWLSGNHDDTTPSWGSIIQGVTHLDKQLIDLANLKIYGLNYRPAKKLQEELANIPPEANVLVCHQLLDASFPQEGIHNLKMEWIPGNIKLVVLGDNHAPVDYTDKRGVKFVYNGSTSLQKFGECASKFFTTIHLDKSDVIFNRVPLRTRKLFEFDIRSEKDYDELAKWLIGPELSNVDTDTPDEYKTPLLRVTFSPSVADVNTRVRELVGDKAHLWLVPTRVFMARQKTDTITEVTVTAALQQLVNSTVNPDLYEFCLSLLTSESPRDALDEWRKSLGVTNGV